MMDGDGSKSWGGAGAGAVTEWPSNMDVDSSSKPVVSAGAGKSVAVFSNSGVAGGMGGGTRLGRTSTICSNPMGRV